MSPPNKAFRGLGSEQRPPGGQEVTVGMGRVTEGVLLCGNPCSQLLFGPDEKDSKKDLEMRNKIRNRRE